MGSITIYRFSLYDIRSDELVPSRRWGTLDAIEKVGGQVDETSAFETDESSIHSDVIGLTEIGFVPPIGSIIPSVVGDTIATEGIGT